MPVRFLKHVALEIPAADADRAIRFYTDFGLQCRTDGAVISFACASRRHDSIHLVPGPGGKKIHHVALGTDAAGLASLRARVTGAGLALLDAPAEFPGNGLWFRDPHGLLFH